MSTRLKRHTTHNAKPYDRPKTFFQKVASTLQDMFVPSWILYNSSNKSDSSVSQTPANQNSEDNTESQQTLHQINHQKISDRGESSKYLNVRNESSKNMYMPEKRPTYSSYTIEQEKRRREKAQISDLTDNYNEITQGKTSNLLKSDTLRNNVKLQKKSTHQSFVNGDDHSDNSDGSASTSGCSSLVSSHQERKDQSHEYGLQINEEALEQIKKELSKKEEFKNKGVKRHISVETESLTHGTDSNFNQSELHSWYKEKIVCPNKRARPQPTFTGRKPSFNLSSFGAPSLGEVSHSGGNCCHSPFYEGKTTFGGASAMNRSHILSSISCPDTNASNTKLKVNDASSKKDFDYMSTTAKRILLSLEKMSTPLVDAKKIPTEKKTFVESYLRRKMNSSSNNFAINKSKSQLPLCKPPTSGIIIPSSPMICKNFDSRISSDQVSNKIIFNPVTISTDITPSASMPIKTTGKIRARTNTALHCSKKANMNEVVEVPDLPNIPLPIDQLPTFNFNTVSKASGECNQSKENNEIQFKFSSPIQHNAPSPPQVSNLKEMCFTFSSPVIKENDSLSNSPQNEKSKQEDSSNEKVACTEEKVSSASKEPDTSVEQKQIKPIGFGDKFKPAPGSWECSTCFVRNSKDDMKCISCETPKTNVTVSTQEKTGFSDTKLESNITSKTIDKSSKQEEKTDNKNSFSIPSTKATTSSWQEFGDKFKPPSGSWSCPVCMIFNEQTDSKCLACETPNPHQKSPVAEQAPTTKFDTKFKSTPDSWDCDVCFAQNPSSALRCFACETLRCVTSKPSDSTQLFSGFKFGSNKKQNSSFSLENTAFNNNNSGFKFGMTPSSGLSTSKQSQEFTFGSKATDSKPVEGFKFNASNFSTSSSAFTFGGKSLQVNSECNNLTNGKIKFGVGSSENPQTTGFGSKSLPAFEPPKLVPQLFGNQLNTAKSEAASYASLKSPVSQSSLTTPAVSSVAPVVSVAPASTLALSTATTTVSIFSFGKTQPVVSVTAASPPKINAEDPTASANSNTGCSFSFTSPPKIVDISNRDTILPEKVETTSENKEATNVTQKPISTFSFSSTAVTTSSIFKPTTVNNVFTFGSPVPFSVVSTQQNVISPPNPFTPNTTSQVSFSNFGNNSSTTTFGHDNNQPKQGFGFQALPAVQFNSPKSEQPSGNVFRFGTLQEQKPADIAKSNFTFGASQEQKPPGGDQAAKQSFAFSFHPAQAEQKTFAAPKGNDQEKPKPSFNFSFTPSQNFFSTPSTSAPSFNFATNVASPGTPFSFTASPSGTAQPTRRIKRAVRRSNLGPGRRDN
ncbi:nuclear pore complex protein Nup153-like [Centruroides sculpturatus]|uniref:nuclear pore complex protein Nup153-like n=1 Tax=Centruroides sculpturatus TaxID=218467 RepID=UPI000C6D12DF|nr:nuclear pore complex protein Nup153-like [Centruroides sculpturatus]